MESSTAIVFSRVANACDRNPETRTHLLKQKDVHFIVDRGPRMPRHHLSAVSVDVTRKAAQDSVPISIVDGVQKYGAEAKLY